MSIQNQLPEFSRVEAVISELAGLGGPAESHATLCGMVCVSGAIPLGVWLRHVLGDAPDAGPDSADEAGGDKFDPLLTRLHRVTLEQLASAQLEFHLLLPSDDEALTKRVQALASWCQGFLYGLAVGGLQESDHVSDIVYEVTRDLVEIARLGQGADQGDEQDETAFAELVEFVRMGVVLVHDELRPPDVTSGPSGDRVLH